MIIASVSEIKAKFSSYLKKSLAGEEVIVSSHNTPVASLKALKQTSKKPVQFGLAKGLIKLSGKFNDSIKSFEDEFYNNDLTSS